MQSIIYFLVGFIVSIIIGMFKRNNQLGWITGELAYLAILRPERARENGRMPLTMFHVEHLQKVS